jgi:hypothetical protein
LAGMEELFQSGSIDQNRSSANWPLAKILQRYMNHVTRRLGLNPQPESSKIEPYALFTYAVIGLGERLHH